MNLIDVLTHCGLVTHYGVTDLNLYIIFYNCLFFVQYQAINATMVIYYQLDPWVHNSLKFESKYTRFPFNTMHVVC